MAPILGYWDLRGLCESIRYLLHYKGINFEDKKYGDMESWTSEKFTLGLDFPNLPYFIDDDVHLTQSNTILRYLANKHGLAGNTEAERQRINLAEQQATDFRTQLIMLCYSPQMEENKADFVNSVPLQLKLWTNFLGDRKFLTGDSITYVDFMAYEVFDFYEMLIPGLYKDFPAIKDYQRRFEAIPELQAYFHSDDYKRWPIFSSRAQFGYHGENPKKEE